MKSINYKTFKKLRNDFPKSFDLFSKWVFVFLKKENLFLYKDVSKDDPDFITTWFITLPAAFQLGLFLQFVNDQFSDPLFDEFSKDLPTAFENAFQELNGTTNIPDNPFATDNRLANTELPNDEAVVEPETTDLHPEKFLIKTVGQLKKALHKLPDYRNINSQLILNNGKAYTMWCYFYPLGSRDMHTISAFQFGNDQFHSVNILNTLPRINQIDSTIEDADLSEARLQRNSQPTPMKYFNSNGEDITDRIVNHLSFNESANIAQKAKLSEWQLCPKCLGNKRVLSQFGTSAFDTFDRCDICNENGIIAKPIIS